MANLSDQVSLPYSVEHLLYQISAKKSLAPVSPDVRRKLAELGEERAAKLLSRISNYNIWNLDNYVMRSIQNDSVDDSSQKPACQSPCSSPSSIARLDHIHSHSNQS